MTVIRIVMLVALCLLIASPGMAKDECSKALTEKVKLTKEYVAMFEQKVNNFVADIVKEAKKNIKGDDTRKAIKKLSKTKKQEEAKKMISELNATMNRTLTRLKNLRKILKKELKDQAYDKLYDDDYKKISEGKLCAD